MSQWTETVEVSGVKWEVTFEYTPGAAATHTDPEVPEELYPVSIKLNGDEWLDDITHDTAMWFAEQAKAKASAL